MKKANPGIKPKGLVPGPPKVFFTNLHVSHADDIPAFRSRKPLLQAKQWQEPRSPKTLRENHQDLYDLNSPKKATKN